MATLEEVAKLLLDEDRLLLLGMAARQPCGVDDFAAALAPKRTNLARHLAQLVDAGMLAVEGAPGQECYTLDVRRLQTLKAALFARPPAETPATPEEKTLAAFVRAGRLTHIPVQPAKRLLILRWLAEGFEPGRAYPEREVNELLGGHGEDYASLRRYLVDYGFLTRAGGVYRRAEEQEELRESGVGSRE
jgi:hypothetical protein